MISICCPRIARGRMRHPKHLSAERPACPTTNICSNVSLPPSCMGSSPPRRPLHLRRWLTAPGYEEYRPAIAELIHAGAWDELEAAFWTIIPFGTAGRRGRMHPFGSATINDRTIGESAQALADVRRRIARPRRSRSAAPRCAHRLRHAASFTPVCRTLRRDHGRRRLRGVVLRRVSGHAGAGVTRFATRSARAAS